MATRKKSPKRVEMPQRSSNEVTEADVDVNDPNSWSEIDMSEFD